ncbi:sodium:calcium antiporter [Sediminitomix flava]|uniref:Cation:H+ antiporter n=1 Tax=Sediminitomix flava TaxID=379075 RepID=A0A315ZBI4_SEDFL|nr:pseudouridine synthase [Sediminitomix flava]PWJ42519.1 cation:H+ antiporter [Sediminitomix flava]
MTILIPILLITFCCVIIWRACDGFEIASDYLGRNMSDGVKGGTINAIASSIPELFTTLFFLLVLKDAEGFASGLGTTAGSAIFNSMVIPAVSILGVLGAGLATRISVSKNVIARDGISLILAELILLIFVSGTELNWQHGLLLMSLYFFYLVYMLYNMRNSSNEAAGFQHELEPHEGAGTVTGVLKAIITLDLEVLFLGDGKINTARAWALLLVSTAFVGASCYLLVEACIELGDGLDWPIYFVSVIIASAATSVPDTIMSYKDAMKGNYDDALANALGSNIFDICFALGMPLFFFTLVNGPIHIPNVEINDGIGELRVMLLFMTIGAFLIFYIGQYMGRLKAYALLTLYVLFIVYILGTATGNVIAKTLADQFVIISHWFAQLI